MHIDKALSQISEIHAQVLKTEVFRGYRAVTMLATGVIAVLAAWAQGSVWSPDTGLRYTLFWVAIALFCAAVCGVDIYWNSLRKGGQAQRFRSVLVVAQTLPALLTGAVVTAILVQRPGQEPLLPGLWAIIYALGIWSARPYLPKAVGLVSLFYFLAGTWLLTSSSGAVPSPWEMGVTFGVGQAGVAVVLYFNVERPLGLPGGRKEVDHGQP